MSVASRMIISPNPQRLYDNFYVCFQSDSLKELVGYGANRRA
jgi:hypothetical protein